MKTVLITGATSGFGKGLVEKFLSEGFKVFATGRNITKRPEILASIRDTYASQLVELDLDVTDKAQIEKVGELFNQRPLDILVNNAGYGVFGSAEDCSEEKMRKQFEVNFFGLVQVTQNLLPAIRKSSGRIINFSSVFGFVGFPLSSFYCATKFAVEGFSESLSYELAPFGVKVILIQPGGYKTGFNTGIEWGVKPNSVYQNQISNYMKLRASFETRPEIQKPQDVIDGVVRIAKSKCPRISYTFGKDAMLSRIARSFMPRSWYHRLTSKIFVEIFNK